jgi:hypothetical protein
MSSFIVQLPCRSQQRGTLSPFVVVQHRHYVVVIDLGHPLWLYIACVMVAVVSRWYELDVAIPLGWRVSPRPRRPLALSGPRATSSVWLPRWHLYAVREQALRGEGSLILTMRRLPSCVGCWI